MRRALVSVLFFQLICAVFAADALRDYLQSETRRWGISVSAADLDQLVNLKRKADQPNLSKEERTKAYTDLFHFVQKIRGFPEGGVPANMAASIWAPGQSLIPSSFTPAKNGELGNFKKRGSGPLTMILIPGLGADWSVFDSFMQRNQSKFTFYAITLPGFGGTAPPARPGKLDFGDRHWWNNATRGVLNLIEKEKLNRPILLGHQAGAYLAMKFALDHPNSVSGTIVLNGLLNMALPGVAENTTPAERSRIVNSWTPVELFPNPTSAQYKVVALQSAAWFCKDPKRQDFLAELMAQSGPAVWWYYFAELATTDLSQEIKNLKVPMLVVPSVYDPDPQFESSKVGLTQWTPLDHSKSSLPITVVPIHDCRAYATEDQPAKLDEVIRNWIDQVLEAS